MNSLQRQRRNAHGALFAVSALVSIFLPLAAFAAADAGTPIPDGLTLCQYFTHKEQILVSLSSDLTETIQGGAMGLTGTLENRSDIALVDASVYVKIVDRAGSGRLVDIIPALELVTLAPHEVRDFTFTWNVPGDAELGGYGAEAIITRAERDPLVGAFDASLSGSPYFFSVVGESFGTLTFSGAALVDGKAGQGEEVITTEDGPLTVSASLKNDSAEPIKASASWKVYASSGPRSDRLIQQTTTEIKAHPKSETEASLTLHDTEHGEYFIESSIVRGTMTAKTFIHIFRSHFAEPRLTQAGVSAPETGVVRQAYVCVNSAGVDSDGVVITLRAERLGFSSILNMFGPLAEARYEGSIPKTLPFALAAPVHTDKSVAVVAEIYHGGKLLDEVTVPYGSDGAPNSFMVTIVAVVVLALIILLGYALSRRKSA